MLRKIALGLIAATTLTLGLLLVAILVAGIWWLDTTVRLPANPNGHGRLARRWRRYARETQVERFTTGNAIQLLRNGAEFFPALIEAIKWRATKPMVDPSGVARATRRAPLLPPAPATKSKDFGLESSENVAASGLTAFTTNDRVPDPTLSNTTDVPSGKVPFNALALPPTVRAASKTEAAWPF